MSLYYQFLQVKDQGVVVQEFSFHFIFVGKKLKHAIDDYHLLIPGMTKTIKSKVVHDEVNEELDDGSKRFGYNSKVFKVFNNVEYKGNVVGYNPKTKIYQIEYEDGD